MHHIILDTDPGVDDALAIFLALASPEIQASIGVDANRFVQLFLDRISQKFGSTLSM